MSRRSYIFVAAVCAVLAISLNGCNKSTNSSGSKVVYVDIQPLAFFVESIAGDSLECRVLVPPGAEAHSFQPTARQITELSSARLYISAGMPFGNVIRTKLATSGGPHTIDLLEEFGGSENVHHDHSQHEGHAHGEMHDDDGGHDGHDEHAHHNDADDHDDDDHEMPHHDDEDGDHHEHENDHGHHHGESGIDPHFWMSAVNAIKITEIVRDELCELYPDNSEKFSANAAKLISELQDLHHRLSESLAPLAGRSFYVFHPAFGHFARDYDLHQVAIENEGKSPSPKQVVALIQKAQAEGVKVIFVQPQFSPMSAEAIANEIDGVVESIDPLSKDYIGNLEDIANKLSRALGGEHDHSHAAESSN